MARAPKTIGGRYRIERTLGKGAGGVVYLVRDLQEEGRPLALKRVEVPKKGPAPLLDDLKNEFSTLSLLHHPHLAAVFDFSVGEKEVFFTSEFVDGRNILETCREADLNTVFYLLVQILRALDYLHQRGVLHLDLKPANILVSDPDRTGQLGVKLIDFGIAQWKRRGRIQTGEFFGTPPFAAPEILLEKDPTPASDIYSLGMILHQVFTGNFPFNTQDPMEILIRQTYEEPQKIEKLDPALPPSFAEVLRGMVRRDPAERISGARGVLEEINRFLGENFSLRSPRAPVGILEESDYLFHPEIFERLCGIFEGPPGPKIILAGPPGSGKTRMVERLKARLQLKGMRPVHYTQGQSAGKNLKNLEKHFPRPLLVDEDGLEEEGFKKNLLIYPGAVLRTVSNGERGEPNQQVFVLPSLDEEKLRQYFTQEFHSSPENLEGEILSNFSPLYPATLERLLQALREEGRLVWGPQGWTHRGGESLDMASLPTRQADRETQRKNAIRVFLENSGLAFPAPILEGLAGLEEGALRDFFKNWLEEGWMTARVHQGISYYRASSTPAASHHSQGNLGGPDVLSQKLQSLYEQGKFSAGVALVDFLEKESDHSFIPPSLRIFGARHLMAGGKYQRALDFLPIEIPMNSRERGLFHEIRGRVLHRLGRLSEAAAEAKLSEKAYREGKDASGLARALNIFGSLASEQNHFMESEVFFQRAVEAALSVGDYYNAGIIQSNRALTFQHQGKIDASLQAHQRAWEFARKNKNPFLLQVIYHNWVMLLYDMGKSSEAEQACYEWLKIALSYGARDQQAFAFNYLALLAGQRNHVELQRSYLDQAIALLEPDRSPRLAAQMRVNRAFLNWSEGNFLPAQLDAESALQWARRLPDDPVLAWVNLALGIVYRDRSQNDLLQAKEFLDEALGRVERQQIRPLRWEVLFHLGLLEKRRGDLEKARDDLTRAGQALAEMMADMPESLKASYLRDRKAGRIQTELNNLDRVSGLKGDEG